MVIMKIDKTVVTGKIKADEKKNHFHAFKWQERIAILVSSRCSSITPGIPGEGLKAIGV